MSESARKKQRISPRVSGDADTITESNPSTLYNDLQRLATIAPEPVTPFRRAASVGQTPRSAPIRTPGTARTPRGGPATRALPAARRAAPTTPHAIRALRERANAARTPGHVRRRSGRVQRETPRDILRDLSRVLARDTRPAAPSPQVQPRLVRHSALDLPDIDDGPEPAVPRLSMHLEDMYDDDSIHEAPPRQSLLPVIPDDVDNGTIQSLEVGRRAISEDPRMMFSTRVSGQFGDLNDLTINGEEFEFDGNFINRRRTMNPDDLLEQVAEEGLDDTTTEMRALTGRRDGRPSDVDLGVFGGMEDDTDEPIFHFTIPPRMQAPVQEEVEDETRGRLDETIVETIAENDDDDDGDVQAGADLGEKDNTSAIAVDDDEPGAFEIEGWESEPEVEDDADLQAYREEVSAIDRSLQTPAPDTPAAKQRAGRQRKSMNMSRFGHEYPSFPAATVKTLANGFIKSQGSKSKISKDTLAALVQTSDFFFEQIGEDLAAYAQHGGRKMIEESDVIALLKRTRQITKNSTYFSLAQKLLPRELLQQLRMEPLPKLKRQKRKRMDTIHEGNEDE